MIGPYKMFFVDAGLSLLFIFSILFYSYIFPKRKINLFTILLMVSFLPLISILRIGTYESGDLSLHAAFAIPFFESLKEGNLIPVWNEYVMNGYGYPLYLFTYPLPYYFAAIVHLIGFTFINSLKIILGVSFVISGIAMYHFLKEELKNPLAAFTGSVFYLFAPYHLVDLHFRVSIGENLAFVFLPLCFLSIAKIFSSGSLKWVVFLSVFSSLLILSHQAISLIAFPFLLLYAIFLFTQTKKTKLIISVFFALMMGVLLSGFYWIPVIFEAKYTSLLTNIALSFSPLKDYVYSPWRFGFLYQGPKGELSFIVGYLHWLIIILSPVLILKKTKMNFFPFKHSIGKIQKRDMILYLGLIISFFAIFFMTQEISRSIWISVPVLRGFQFSYRMLIFLVFFSSVIAAIFVKVLDNKVAAYILCTIAIFITILNWGNRGVLPQVTDDTLRLGLSNVLPDVGPGTPVWASRNILKTKKTNNIEISTGIGSAIEIKRTSISHQYLLNIKSDKADLKENTLYFPNWTVKVNNKIYPFEYQNPYSPGLITFSLPKGFYKVEVVFLNTKTRIISQYLSLTALIIILILALFSIFKTIEVRLRFIRKHKLFKL